MNGKTDEILELIRHPGSSDPYVTVTAVRDLLKDCREADPELLSGLRGIKSELRGRNVPGNTSTHVIEGDYLDAIPGIIADDCMYKLVTDLECRFDPKAQEDVDLRSVTQLYMELVDIVALDLREACRESRRYPSEKNISDAVRCLGLISSLFLAGARQLSLHSTDSPASFRMKAGKCLTRCKEHVSLVTVGTGIRSEVLVNALADLCDTFDSLTKSAELMELQGQRNANYREYHKNIHDWLVRNIMKLNAEMEDLDQTDVTQRRYLSQLVTLSQEALDRYNGDH